MPETAKQTVKSRTETHSDVAATPAAKAYQAALTERQFGALVLAHLREAKGGAFTLRNLQEEWIATDDGMVHEISAEADIDESNPIRPQAAPEPAEPGQADPEGSEPDPDE